MQLWMYFILGVLILPTFWSIWHSFTHTFPYPQERRLWFVITTFFPVIGAVLYFLFGYKRVIKEKA